MGLLGNGSVLNKSTAFLTSGTGAQSGHAGNFHKDGRYRNRHGFFRQQSSVPDGYDWPNAIKPARKSTSIGVASQTDIAGVGTISSAAGISARISMADLTGTGSVSSAALGQVVNSSASLSGSGSVSSAALASISTMASALSGSGSVSDADMKALIPVTAGLSGSSSLSPELKGHNRMTADITPFTDLSPESLAASLMSQTIETGYDLESALRLILSAVAGKISGAGTSTITIRSVTDGTDRIVATVDSNGNRTAITYDVGDE